MKHSLSKTPLRIIERLLSKKKAEFEQAVAGSRPHYEINSIYKELKELQQEKNHRMVNNWND